MGTLDIVLIVCFIPAIIRGISRGFVEQVVALISIFAGAWLGFRYGSVIAEWAAPYLNISDSILRIISFVAVVLVAVIILNLIGRLIAKTLKLALLGWLDRLLGLVFALLKAALIIGIVIILFDALNARFGFVRAELLDGSVLYKAIKSIADTVFPYLKDFISDAKEMVQGATSAGSVSI